MDKVLNDCARTKRAPLWQKAGFAASSLLGFCVDYCGYSLFGFLLAPLGAAAVPLSNILARVLSAGVNFWVNRRFVFHSRAGALRSGAAYASLALCILAGNTLLLSALVNGCGWNKYGAKLLTEITFFSLSYLVQKRLIFAETSGIGQGR